MRRAAKVDDNQPEIVAAFRQMGCQVQPLHAVGSGCPDLAVSTSGRTYMVEVKDGSKSPSRRALTPDQQVWHACWQDEVYIVETVEQVELLVKIWRLA